MKKCLLMVAACVVATAIIILSCLYNGIIQVNGITASFYDVKGVDVSHYQGEINWPVLSGQGIEFAYIKATEGASYQDEYFSYNWEEASKTDIRIGAYHFFSFESSGADQGENFINCVSEVDNMMPPAVDVEPYGAYGSLKQLDSSMLIELNAWLKTIEDYYGVRPIIYTTAEFVDQIKEEFPKFDIWIRSVYSPFPSTNEWKIWQYSNRKKLDGYSGGEKFIDMNVFSGTIEEFRNYGKGKSDEYNMEDTHDA